MICCERGVGRTQRVELQRGSGKHFALLHIAKSDEIDNHVRFEEMNRFVQGMKILDVDDLVRWREDGMSRTEVLHECGAKHARPAKNINSHQQPPSRIPPFGSV